MTQEHNDLSLPLVFFENKIILPFDEETFKDFIVSLLGKPKIIEGHLKGSYLIDKGLVEELDQYLDNIINELNDASLIEFNAIINFNNNSSISFNRIEELLTFNQCRSLVCTGLTLSWIYLINFKKDQPSRKQQITISMINKDKDSFLSEINYSVEYTTQQWGIITSTRIHEFLENLIKQEEEKIILYEIRKSLANTLYYDRGAIFCFLLIIMAFPELFVYSSEFLKKSTKDLHKQLNGLTSENLDILLQNMTIDDKLNLLIEVHRQEIEGILSSSQTNISISEFLSGESLIIFLWFIKLIVIGIFIFIFIYSFSEIIKLPSYGFILLTEKSKNEKNKYFLKRKKGIKIWIISTVSSVVLALATGVVANYIYRYLTN